MATNDTEPNNSNDYANTITLKQNFIGQIGNSDEGINDVDWYKLSVPSKSTVTFSFKSSTKTGGYVPSLQIPVYNVYFINTDGSEAKSGKFGSSGDLTYGIDTKGAGDLYAVISASTPSGNVSNSSQYIISATSKILPSTPATTLTSLPDGSSTTNQSNTSTIIKNPTYNLVSSAPTVNEGSAISFSLTTTNVPTGTLVPFSISGIDSTDVVSGQLSGSLKIGANGKATTTITLAADKSTEGIENLNFSIPDKNVNVSVIDTSQGFSSESSSRIAYLLSTANELSPNWMNLRVLDNFSSLAWQEKNGRNYVDFNIADNNLSWSSGKSLASYITKNTAAKFTEKFVLNGEDKTSLFIDRIKTNTTENISFTYSTGKNTPLITDDVSLSTVLLSNSSDQMISIAQKYTDGTGISSNFSITTNEKKGTFKYSYSYNDFNNNAINIPSIDASSKGISVASGSIKNSELMISWSKNSGLSSTLLNFHDVAVLVMDNVTDENASSNPFDAISNDLFSVALNFDNVINIFSTSEQSKSVDGGLGNDIINGGKGSEIILGGLGNDILIGGAGDDVLSGGLGTDKLTGGAGNDTFKISKSDFDFTSTKTVLVDTIADFKYTATEKDSISLDGFGSMAVFQTVALAKKAGSTANVIYESKTGNFWYNEDGDSALVGALLFANAKGISDTYWVAAGVI